MPINLEDEIRENAAGPARAAGDARSVEQHKLTEQIAADKQLAVNDEVPKSNRGLHFHDTVPPVAVLDFHAELQAIERRLESRFHPIRKYFLENAADSRFSGNCRRAFA